MGALLPESGPLRANIDLRNAEARQELGYTWQEAGPAAEPQPEYDDPELEAEP